MVAVQHSSGTKRDVRIGMFGSIGVNMAEDAPAPLDVDAGASRSQQEQTRVSQTQVPSNRISPILTVWQRTTRSISGGGGRVDFLFGPAMKTILLAPCESDVFLHARFMRYDNSCYLFPGIQNSLSDED